MHIKKIASLLFLGCLLFLKTNAQNEKIFNQLNTLYTLDNYQECIKKANKYIQNSKTAKDAYPYLYMSMCYFGIYQNLEHYDPKEYKDPLRKALSYAGRYMKRDKKEELKGESSDFLDQLHSACLRESAYMNKNTDWHNLQNLAREMIKDYTKDYPTQLIAGTYLIYAGVKGEGEKAIDGALDSLKKTPAIPDSILQTDYVNAFVIYTNYLSETKDTKKENEVIKLALDICPGNEELKDIDDQVNSSEAPKTSH